LCKPISLISGSRAGRRAKSAGRGAIPTINHERGAFIENKRYPKEQRRFDDVVNRNAGFVYQTDAVLNLIRRVQSALARPC
jgi:hypothetical protein